jgi:hypothetical protein
MIRSDDGLDGGLQIDLHDQAVTRIGTTRSLSLTSRLSRKLRRIQGSAHSLHARTKCHRNDQGEQGHKQHGGRNSSHGLTCGPPAHDAE